MEKLKDCVNQTQVKTTAKLRLAMFRAGQSVGTNQGKVARLRSSKHRWSTLVKATFTSFVISDTYNMCEIFFGAKINTR
jgi:hypothetical protein